MKWILISALASTLGLAQNYERTSQNTCTEIDLRTDLLQEVRDQKEVSWCYAFTGADMLTYFYNLPEKASAADVAINYNDSDIASIMRDLRERFRLGERETFMMPHQTGFNKVSLERAMKDGYCPERVFPSESWTKFTKEGSGWSETQVDLKPAMLEIFALLKQKDLTLAKLPFYYQFKNIESAEEFYHLIKASSPHNFYSKLRKEVCQFDRIKFAKKLPVTMYMKDPQVFAAMNKRLSANRIVGIDFDSRILKDRTSRGVRIGELHTSSLVARRWNAEKKECQYLINDSHGKQCTRYDTSYDCLAGQIWMEESLLFPSLLSAVFVDGN